MGYGYKEHGGIGTDEIKESVKRRRDSISDGSSAFCSGRISEKEEPIEFPSFSCKDAKLPEGDEGIKLVTEGIKEVIGIEIKNPRPIETFFDDEYPFYHYIFRVVLRLAEK